ncbi:Inversin, partial [Fusarium oxysporum f. sp. albedinis]
MPNNTWILMNSSPLSYCKSGPDGCKAGKKGPTCNVYDKLADHPSMRIKNPLAYMKLFILRSS